MFLNFWGVRLEISVGSAHFNLNGLSVRLKNSTIKNRSVLWFGLTDLNRTTREISGMTIRKRSIADEMLLLSFNTQYVKL